MTGQPPFGAVFVMQNMLSSATTTYSADPASWGRTGSPIVWSAFDDLATSGSLLYLISDRRINEINPATSTYATTEASSTIGCWS
ncbi:MAG: hypothetical protein ABIQ55_06660 [Gemmatimonadaceae bacterium]